MISETKELERIVRGWQRWFRVRRGAAWAVHGLIVGLAVSFFLSLAATLRGLLLREEYIFIVLAGPLLAVSAASLAGLAWPFPRLKAARYFDRVFGLRERTSTALELAVVPSSRTDRNPRNPNPASEPASLRWTLQPGPEMLQEQLKDALQAARGVRSSAPLPLRWRRGEILAAGALVLAVILTLARGGAYFQAGYQKRLVQATIQQQATQIQALRSQIENDPALTPEQRRALTQPLEEATRSLRTAKSVEQAVSVLHSTQEKLQALSNAQAQQQAQALQEAGKGLSQAEGNPLQSVGQSLESGNPLEAAQKLQNIDPGSLTPEESQVLAGQLEETASALDGTNPDLAQKMRDAADALRQGDAAAAQKALQQAAQAMSQAGQQIHQAQAAGQAAAQVAQGQQRLIQAGRSAQGQQPGSQANAGQAGGQGSAGSPGPGSGQGTGSQPNGSSGGGAGRGEGGGDNRPGAEAGDNPIGQGNGPGDAGERPYEPIYAPRRLGGSGGENVTLPGSGQAGDQVLGQGNTAPGSPGDSSVPYVEVLPFYEQAYRQAIESGQVPLFLRDVVKKYFSSLQP